MKLRTRIRQSKRDEATQFVATALGKSQVHVRKVIADSKQIRYKGKKSQVIRKTYCHYLNTVKPKIISTLKQYSSTLLTA